LSKHTDKEKNIFKEVAYSFPTQR